MNKVTTTIYALCDPETQDIRYIGQTVDPETRFEQHVYDRARNSKTRWIRSLVRRGQLPVMQTLERCSPEEADGVEFEWIRRGWREGWPLTNRVLRGKARQSEQVFTQRELLTQFRDWLAFLDDTTLAIMDPVAYARTELSIDLVFEQVSREAVLSPYILDHLSKKSRAMLRARYDEWQRRTEVREEVVS